MNTISITFQFVVQNTSKVISRESNTLQFLNFPGSDFCQNASLSDHRFFWDEKIISAARTNAL